MSSFDIKKERPQISSRKSAHQVESIQRWINYGVARFVFAQ
jgi:hypothetical protein